MKRSLRLSYSALLLATGFGFASNSNAATFCGAPAPAGVTAPEFLGSGEHIKPYQIQTGQQLNSIGLAPECKTKYFVLANDIDLAAAGITEFNSIPLFRGWFDGNKKTISGLRTRKSGAGLFQQLGYGGAFGIVTNLNLTNVDIRFNANTWQSTGALAGYANFGAIRNVHVSGTVRGRNQVGGIVGFAQYSTVIDSSFSGRVLNSVDFYDFGTGGIAGRMDWSRIATSRVAGLVRGDEAVGGIAGLGIGSLETIEASSSTAAVQGSLSVGGIIGFVRMARIANCHSLGNITAVIPTVPRTFTVIFEGAQDPRDMYVGGLAGNIRVKDTAIRNSYSAGRVTAPLDARFVGGVFGYNVGATFDSVYWNESTALQPSAGVSAVGLIGITALTTKQMRLQDSYRDWNFTNIWAIQNGVSYPGLRPNIFDYINYNPTE